MVMTVKVDLTLDTVKFELTLAGSLRGIETQHMHRWPNFSRLAGTTTVPIEGCLKDELERA
ncbi:hypothetical protein GCM10009810_26810 [Nostocoides vanveenii]|uniref:Uncharacterized protein n=1 Tax=Nostocoides vanveenii TaxID=330835 RepID=A0ABP4WZC4_9MICO